MTELHYYYYTILFLLPIEYHFSLRTFVNKPQLNLKNVRIYYERREYGILMGQVNREILFVPNEGEITV